MEETLQNRSFFSWKLIKIVFANRVTKVSFFLADPVCDRDGSNVSVVIEFQNNVTCLKSTCITYIYMQKNNILLLDLSWAQLDPPDIFYKSEEGHVLNFLALLHSSSQL